MRNGVNIFRDKNGVAHVKAESLADLYWGLGYSHGTDRLLQMCLMRTIGQGRICELLNDDADSLKVDKFFRRMNWSKNITQSLEALNVEDLAVIESYCKGVNNALHKSYPWEFKLVGYHPEPWKPRDCVLMGRMMGYLTLSQSQDDIQRLFIEMVQAGVSKKKLDELFPGILGGFDFDVINKINLEERIVTPQSLWGQAMPRAMASNNWVVSGDRTQSGKPMLANDPHLEGNRLPNIWYEAVLIGGDRYTMGATMPGVPGILSGRNNDVSWGVTYAFVDNLDAWVESCKDGKYLRKTSTTVEQSEAQQIEQQKQAIDKANENAMFEFDEHGEVIEEEELSDEQLLEKAQAEPAPQVQEQSWHEFELRRETIARKSNPSVVMSYFENEHGTLEGDPNIEGHYLCSRWAGSDSGVKSLAAIINLWSVSSIAHARDRIRQVETGWSFVFADVHGDIGFQMTGLVPIRKSGTSGFVPLAGWDETNNWKGFHSPYVMPNATNPIRGFFVTANHDLNHHGKINPINMCMADYRAQRIEQLLKEHKKIGVSEMRRMHYDVYSVQAELFMGILKPLLPDTTNGNILKEWDLNYSRNSKGAYLFEMVLQCIYHDVFGVNGLGSEVVKHLNKQTGIFVDFFANFDKVLLKEKSLWFGGKSRDEIFKGALERALQLPAKSWGQYNTVILKNIFFDGKLPNICGFDRGPISLIGGRATIHQGQVYKSDGRQTSFMPTIRMITDMSRQEYHTNMLGGPSDRRFSKWYANGVDHWLRGGYKLLTPMPAKKLKFK